MVRSLLSFFSLKADQQRDEERNTCNSTIYHYCCYTQHNLCRLLFLSKLRIDDSGPFMFPYDNSCHYSSAEYSGNVAANGDTAATYHNASLTHSVRFLYLLQTEICLPSNLLTNEALGDGHLDFHVIVLSFKQRCDDNSLPHVDYIFNSSTTWTTGRNILYETAMKYLFVLHIYG